MSKHHSHNHTNNAHMSSRKISQIYNIHFSEFGKYYDGDEENILYKKAPGDCVLFRDTVNATNLNSKKSYDMSVHGTVCMDKEFFYENPNYMMKMTPKSYPNNDYMVWSSLGSHLNAEEYDGNVYISTSMDIALPLIASDETFFFQFVALNNNTTPDDFTSVKVKAYFHIELTMVPNDAK